MLHRLLPGRTRPYIRWSRNVIIACGLALCAVAPAGAEAAAPLPVQGVYDTCDPARSSDGCASRLRRISQAGFKVVQIMGVSPQVSNATSVLLYANTAHAYGLKVIWNVRPEITDVDLLAAINLLRIHPSTWGYYIADEPSPADHDEIAAFSARVKALDPAHPRLIMGCGNCYGGEGSVAPMADIEAVLGTDIYPVWEQAPDQPIVEKRVRDAAAGLRRVADRAGRSTVMALQAWRWGDSHYDSQATGIGQASRFPTRNEIQTQRDAAIEGGRPDLILWFTLNQVIGWEPGQRPWWWSEPSDAAVRWSNLVGGAFAPLPSEANKRPVARFTARAKRLRGSARAAATPKLRLTLNGTRSYDPDGKITRFRWYVSGTRGPVCPRRRCTIKLRRKKSVTVRLVVSDEQGARAWRTRRIRVR